MRRQSAATTGWLAALLLACGPGGVGSQASPEEPAGCQGVTPPPGTVAVCGQVRDAVTGETPSQVVVAVHAQRSGSITDSRGRYWLHVPEGLHWLRADRLGYRPAVRPLLLEGGSAREVPLPLWPLEPLCPPGEGCGDSSAAPRCPAPLEQGEGAVLLLRLMDADGAPAAGGWGWAGILEGDDPGCWGEADAEGRLALVGVPPGSIQVVAALEDGAPAAIVAVRLEPGESADREIRLPPGRAPVVPPGVGDTPPDAPRGGAHPDRPPPGARSAVRPGIEVLLSDSLSLVRGRRVGLVTNQTGVDSQGRSSIDLLQEHPQVTLVALYSPEHGIRGTAEAGELVDSSRDAATGLPIHSLYGATRKPTPAMLHGVEVLLFDIQDIGTRYYTYIYTMALAMEAAGEAGIPFVVLDRPNPLGGTLVQGNVLEPAHASFVGMYPIPMRHGLTPGELARLYGSAFGVQSELHVVPAAGWRRGMDFPWTGLPWIPPSPNMPSLESALHYPGSCLFEGTNLSVGRGTDRAFQQVGAPWLDGEELAARLNRYGLPGVRFESVRFTPRNPGDGKFDGVELSGVRWVSEDPDRYDPTAAGVAALLEARHLAGDRWEWNAPHFDLLAGNTALREGIELRGAAGRTGAAALAELTAGWEGAREAFQVLAEGARIYP